MRALFTFVCLVASTFAADTPSLAGKVFRETGAIASIRRTWERTIVFTSDTRFTYLYSAEGNPLNSTFGSKVLVQAPRSDGTYVVRHVAGASDVADLTFDDGSRTETIPVDAAGTASPPGEQFPNSTTTMSDIAAAQNAPASNISLRGRVVEGRPLIAGFVVPGTPRTDNGQFVPPVGTKVREVLIRVVGPSLTQFGVTGRWADPTFKLYQGSTPAFVNEVLYTDWFAIPTGTSTGVPNPSSPPSDTEAAFRKVFSYAGAFPLNSGSKDAAMLARLAPGAYTIVCEAPAGDAGGEALIEVYFLP